MSNETKRLQENTASSSEEAERWKTLSLIPWNCITDTEKIEWNDLTVALVMKFYTLSYADMKRIMGITY